jgi:hypothetical protein
VASVLIGATKLPQIQDSLRRSTSRSRPSSLARLDAVSRPDTPFPYSFFQPAIQAGLTGGATVGGLRRQRGSPQGALRRG